MRHLFDDFPTGPDSSPDGTPGEPPVLGDGLDVPPPALELEADSESRQKTPWRWLAAAMVAITLLNAAWTFREALMSWPWVSGALADAGWLEPAEPFRDPERIHLVSRDLHTHPSREDVLVLSATFVNLADESQPFPTLELTLKDQDNRTVAGRVFEPGEYLRTGFDPTELLQPGSHVPVLLEFNDPGADAVGFELIFH